MSDELTEAKRKIAETEGKLKAAEDGGNEAFILMYGNLLIELQKDKNFLIASQGKFHVLSLHIALSNPI